jgi:hypothetical protein
MITLKHRRATAAILSAANPTLAAGEFAVESDTGRIKIGNGSTAWVSLGYAFPLESTLATYTALALAESQAAATLDVYPRGEATSLTIGPASGSLFFTWFTPAVTFTASAITMASGSTAASGLTLCRFGIYTYNETTATLVARTASDTTIFGTVNTSYQRSLNTTGGYPATYTLTAGTRYGIGVVIVGTTPPTLAGKAIAVGVSSLTPRTNGTISGQSDLPTTATSIGTAQGHPFARLT